MEPFESFEHAGFTVELHYDEMSEHANPREGDQLGTMVCWHPGYTLGDFQLRGGDGRGSVDAIFETEKGRSDFSSIGTLARYCRTALGAVAVLPLYLLDHSGLSMSAGGNYVGRGDTACGGRDEFGNARGWDTTLVGVIFTTPERVAELCGSADYAPADWAGTPAEWVTKQLEQEVDLYSAWLGGEVYGYTIEDADGDEAGSCWGFLPDVSARDGLEYVREEARSEAEGIRDERARRVREVREGWASARVTA